jgi:hypothetical protein
MTPAAKEKGKEELMRKVIPPMTAAVRTVSAARVTLLLSEVTGWSVDVAAIRYESKLTHVISFSLFVIHYIIKLNYLKD